MSHTTTVRPVQLRTLGGIALTDEDGGEVADVLSRPKELAFIVYLATGAADGHVSRDSLLPLFWPELDESRARHALRQMLYSLRRHLGPGGIRSPNTNAVGLDPEWVVCDASQLLKAAARGDLETVVSLYEGDFLAGFNPGEVSVELEHWIDDVRGRVREAAVQAARTLAEAAERAGDARAAIRWSRSALEIDPLSEVDVHRLVRLHGEAGAVAAALETYERYRLRLEAELSLPPGTEIQGEVRGIRERQREGGPATRGVMRSPVPRASERERQRSRDAGPAGNGRRPRWTGRRLLVIAAAALVVLLLVVLASALSRPGGAPASPAPRLAVVPIQGEEKEPHASSRLAYASAWALSDLGGITVVDPGTVQGLLQRSRATRPQERLRRVWRELGASMVLTIDVRENGAGRTVRLELWHAGSASAPASQARTALTLAGSSPDLAMAARAIAEFLRAGVPGIEVPSGPRVRLTSPEALDAYVLGDRYLYAGEARAALREFQRAVAVDSGFALGWHRLSVAAGMVFNGALADSAADRAGRVGYRLPPRLDLLIEARRSYRRGAPQQAEVALRSLLTLDPEDVEAQHQLAEVLLHFNPIQGRPASEALPLFRATAALGAAQPEAVYHMAQLALLAGDTVAFQRSASELLSLSAAAHRAPQVRILQAHVAGDRDRWRRELAGLSSASDFTVLSAAHNVAVYGRSPAAASDVAQILVDPARASDVRSLGYRVLADLALAQGQAREAWRLLERAEAEQPEATLVHKALMAALPTVPVDSTFLAQLRRGVAGLTWTPGEPSWFFPESALYPELPGYLTAVLALKAGQPGEAARVLRSQAMDPVASGRRSLFDMLVQRYTLSTGALSIPQPDAVTAMKVKAEQATLSPLFSSPDVRYLSAMNADQAGQHRLALRLLASLEENNMPDLALAGPARLAAARIHEMLGEREEAAQKYRGVIELWSAADPEYRDSVDAAREALRRLRREGLTGV